MTPTHLSLFSGIGGIDIAAEWAGFETIGQCEYADYPYQVLLKHWPDVPKWRDVRNVTRKSIIERCGRLPDLISGGFPCQPHSVAGKRKASADERDLWGEFARIICDVRPGWVLAENVSGLRSSEDGRFFGRVLRDMAEMGYHVGWGSWGASDIGAPHRRERIFIVAHDQSLGCDTGRLSVRTDAQIPVNKICCHDVENPVCIRGRGRGDGDPARCECALQAQGSGCCNVVHSDDTGSRTSPHGNVGIRQTHNEEREQYSQCWSCRQGIMADPDMLTPTRHRQHSRDILSLTEPKRPHLFGQYGDKGIAQSGLGGVPDGSSGGMDGYRWPAGIGDPHEWEPPRVTSIKTNRAARLTALGNAVVPQQVYPILEEIRRFMV